MKNFYYVNTDLIDEIKYFRERNMNFQEQNMKKLLDANFIKFVDGVPLRENISEESIEKLKHLDCGSNSVLILGYAKTGNHFLLQILHQLGFKRFYGKTDGLASNKYFIISN